MANRIYCSNVSVELEEWSEKLHKLSGRIDQILTPRVQGVSRKVRSPIFFYIEAENLLFRIV